MIIDCHGHFTTVPTSFREYRARQVAMANDPANAPKLSEGHVTDDEIREGVGNGQLKLQQERGSDLTLFSPIAGLMSHHLGNERTSLEWAEVSNNLVKRVTEIYPDNFVPVCQLPQSPLAPPANSVPELRRCVEEMGFVGCNLNPDPTGGYPPTQPSMQRCIDFGKVLRDALLAWPDDVRFAVIASGGLSHFVNDEGFDHRILKMLAEYDYAGLAAVPDSYYQSGTSEIKIYSTVMMALQHTGAEMALVDYVPCWRTAAGTGEGMGFMYWDASK